MSRALTIGLALGVGLIVGVVGGQMMNPAAEAPARGQGGACHADAISARSLAPLGRRTSPGRTMWSRDGRRIWPMLPGHEKWTYGGARGVFAESPDRVFLLGGGELPNIDRPQDRFLTDVGPNVSSPSAVCRGATPTRRRPRATAARARMRRRAWKPGRASRRPSASSTATRAGTTRSSSSTAKGKVIEDWTQWDNMFKRPHAVYISPYDAEKRVWIVDDHTHAIYIFSNDGKQHLQTIGTPNMPGADATHFNRPTFIAWAPDATFYVADGYNGTRVAKFDKDGKFMFDFGMPGEPGNETRPGYMNNVHGVAVDIKTGNVFVNDRDNHRIQVFDAEGKYLREWKIDANPSSLHFIQIGDDGHAVVFDRNTHKLVKYDLDGRLIYSWGTIGDFPGTIWGVHGMATDQEGNLYLAEVDSGRFQKFTPRAGANPRTLVGKPIYSAWK